MWVGDQKLMINLEWPYSLVINEKLDHMPSSCIMVHIMVKGRQYSACTVQATSMSAPQSLRWSLRPTLDLDTDNFQSQETNSTAPYMHTASLVTAWHTAYVLYIAQG